LTCRTVTNEGRFFNFEFFAPYCHRDVRGANRVGEKL